MMKVRLKSASSKWWKRPGRQYRAVIEFDNGEVWASTEFYANKADRDEALDHALTEIEKLHVQFVHEDLP